MAIDDLQKALLAWLPILLMVALLYLLWRATTAIPRMKLKALTQEARSSIRWADVAGVDEAKEELAEVVEFLRNPDQFARVGARVPKGILLHGPPGTGKTLLARAVAGEAGAAFFAQSASAFVEVYAGLGASRIRKLFESARRAAPAIVFIDELDAVGASRSGTAMNREQDQTLNQLLVELDGFSEVENVVVIAASNLLSALDPALLRPGRFDRQVHVSRPDFAGRLEILGVHSRGKPVDPGVDLRTIARQTAGLAGADLANLCNEAAISAGRREARSIGRGDFDNALDRVIGGLATRRAMTETEKRIVAFHEAGHALCAWVVGTRDAIQKVSIVPRGTSLGYMISVPEEDRYIATREDLEAEIVTALGGRAAEQTVFAKVSTTASADLERCTEIARSMVFELGMGSVVESHTLRADNYALSEETKRSRDEEQSAICERAYAEAQRLCREHRDALDRVAEALLERETLDGDEVADLLADVGRERAA